MNYSPESVQRLLDSDDYGDRLSGVNQLRYLAPEIAFEMLQPLIKDSNARVRYSAVSQLDILGRQNLDLALTILRDRLLHDPEADVKAAAADAIGGLKLTAAYDDLVAVYQQSCDWLIQLLAQTGSFVPAKSAKISICDRIFTRVGAVDDLATGQSTFMVEMNETANILNHATDRSLVLLDEIGRGTATFDGLSIAWSVAEYLATVLQSRTIFATHYHELNELASILENVANYQVTVKELPHEIVFLHQVRPGGADKSYGIEAGRLAGLPASVIDRAMQVMGQIEKHSKIAIGLRQGIKKIKPVKSDNSPSLQQLDIFDDSK